MQIRIGLGGKSGHGKDSAAASIRDYFLPLGLHVRIYSISELICAELGLVRGEVKDVEILQRHSHLRCSQDTLYWARQVQAAAERDSSQIALISNVRRMDEALFYRERDWTLARIEAVNEHGSPYVSRIHDRDPNDSLECELDGFNWDYRIAARKPGGLAWLQRQAAGLAEHLIESEAK